MTSTVDAALRGATDAILGSGAIGAMVYVDGQIHCGGFANLQANEPMAPGHRLRVGSMDKTFIAVVTVETFDDLHVPANRWIPELDERITLWHLLTHRSGLFDYMWDGETYERISFGRPVLFDSQDFVRTALTYPLRKFGEVKYSSSNYAALDVILERETGRPLGDLVREHVLEPYRLARTTFQYGLDLLPDVAHGYALKGGTFPAVESPRDVTQYWIDRSIATDAHDLASFYRQVFHAHPEMVENEVGIRSFETSAGVAYGHGGAMAGYSILLLASKDAQHIVFAYANSHSLPVLHAVRTATKTLF